MKKMTFENGVKSKNAYVTIDGINHDIIDAVYTGETPISAENLNQMQANMEEVGVQVNSTQPTTNESVWLRKTKNLFNLNTCNFRVNQNATYSISDGVIEVTVPAGAVHSGIAVRLNEYLPEILNSTVMISADIMVGDGLDKVALNLESYTQKVITSTEWGRYSIKGYVTEKYYVFSIYGFNSSDSDLKFYVKNIQIEYSSTASDNENYVKDEFLIKNANGIFNKFSDTVSVDNQKSNANVWLQHSKNMVKIINKTISNNGVTITPISNSEIKISGTPTANIYTGIVASIYLKANQTYTISTNQTLNSEMFIYSNKAENVGLTYADLQLKSSLAKSFTPTKDGEIDLALYIYSGKGAIDLNLKIQVEKGTSKTDYEEYIEDKIFVKNANGVYEELKVKQTKEYDLLLDTTFDSELTTTTHDTVNLQNYDRIFVTLGTEYEADTGYLEIDKSGNVIGSRCVSLFNFATDTYYSRAYVFLTTTNKLAIKPKKLVGWSTDRVRVYGIRY